MDIVITVDGVPIIDDVILADATFTSMANGAAGTCSFRVRDSAHVYTLIVGKEITLDIDGVRTWGGFISQIERGYFFDAYDCKCRVKAVPRYLEVHGVDYNVLFQKRWLEDFAQPKNVIMTSFPAGTDDSTVIDYYIANHLDLTGDGITTSLVQHVSTPSTDEPIFGQAGMNWDAFMRRMAFNTGAIWYLNPDKVVVYADVETEDAPYGISDNPGAGQIGCQGMEILFDGSDLINDALVWGLDQASTSPAFSRIQDATSIATHGRWQHAEPFISAHLQATVDRTASTFVNGSPQSLRGHKDDAKSIKCAIFQSGFRVAQKVHVTSDVFGFDDIIPIRAIKVTFPTTTQARWDLTIATEYDTPWIGFDVVPFLITIPPPGPIPLDISIPIPQPSGCLIFDDFGRTFDGTGDPLSTWGIPSADGVYEWDGDVNSLDPTNVFSVSDGEGHITPHGAHRNGRVWPSTSRGTAEWTLPVDFEFDIRFTNGSTGLNTYAEIDLTGVKTTTLTITPDGSATLSAGNFQFLTGQDFSTTTRFRVRREASVVYAKWWKPADTEPTSWMLTATNTGSETGVQWLLTASQAVDVEFGVHISNLRVVSNDVEVSSCSTSMYNDTTVDAILQQHFNIRNETTGFDPATSWQYVMNGSTGVNDWSLLPGASVVRDSRQLQAAIGTCDFSGWTTDIADRTFLSFKRPTTYGGYAITAYRSTHIAGELSLPFVNNKGSCSDATPDFSKLFNVTLYQANWGTSQPTPEPSDSHSAVATGGFHDGDSPQRFALDVAATPYIQFWMKIEDPLDFSVQAPADPGNSDAEAQVYAPDLADGVTWDFSYVVPTSILTVTGGSPVGVTPPPQGPVCENLTQISTPPGGNAQYLYYSTGAAYPGTSYMAGSAQVWFDGLFLRNGQDYIEDPNNGLIAITNTSLFSVPHQVPDQYPHVAYGCFYFQAAIITV